MHCIVIYDIADDRLRAKVADICLDYGLNRIQYSAFFGKLTRNQKEELFKKAKRVMGKAVGNIQIYPVCEKDLALKMEHIVTKD